jgi:hypothetical protein
VIDCLTIKRDLHMWCDILRDCKVNDVPTYVGEPWFQRCDSCRRGRKAPTTCKGARIAIERGQRIRFPPTDDGLVPELAVRTKRSGPGESDIEEHSVEVYVRDLSDGTDNALVHFSRVDLGRGTAEPRYHVQFGGCADEGGILHPKADCLRWPGPLYDFVLASELVLYTFYRPTWQKNVLCKKEALHLVRQSERNYLRLWMDQWQNYSVDQPVGKSFLAVSCTSHRQAP